MTTTSRDPINDRLIQRYVYGVVGSFTRQSILDTVSRDVTAPIQAGVFWEVSSNVSYTCHSVHSSVYNIIKSYAT